jgi:hypothetical protein
VKVVFKSQPSSTLIFSSPVSDAADSCQPVERFLQSRKQLFGRHGKESLKRIKIKRIITKKALMAIRTVSASEHILACAQLNARSLRKNR